MNNTNTSTQNLKKTTQSVNINHYSVKTNPKTYMFSCLHIHTAPQINHLCTLFQQFFISLYFSTYGSSHRVMIRTCNGLELRDAGYFPESEAFEDPSGLFPSASSRDELTPRFVCFYTVKKEFCLRNIRMLFVLADVIKFVVGQF